MKAASQRRGIDASRPDTEAILAQLKDFQRDTVEYVFRRLYLDTDCVRRFLVADEVGLGKTLVASGVIARSIDYLWDRAPRIDVVYVCSNSDIARQNIRRLNITKHNDFCLASRITLLPINMAKMQLRRVNFVSFTPGTSFELSQGAGQSLERQLLYWLIANQRSVSFTKATRLLAANADTDGFRDAVKMFPECQPSPHPKIAAMFWNRLQGRDDLLRKFDDLCEAMPRKGASVPSDIHRARIQLVGELRRLLAEACLHWLEPDVIILDEFQRFKHLLEGEGDEVSEAAQLAHHLFNYQQSQEDASTAARVLLLSATPYKMYTLAQEKDQDDHYADFKRTLDFLMPSADDRQSVSQLIQAYREQLLQIGESGTDSLRAVKRQLEESLRKVMVRTERLATTADRNGMLAESRQTPVRVAANDIQQYLHLQTIARSVADGDIMDYWKSAPYLLNFMEDYELKRKIRERVEAEAQTPEFVRAMRQAAPALLSREEIEKYRKLDAGNARLRALHEDTIQRGAWRLLWMPPSLPYYEPSGSFAQPDLVSFTKRLVFSCWRVVPKAIASVLSYEAEREMTQSFRKRARNTAEARGKRRALLRFTFSKGRPTGMPVLALVYPCRWLASRFDPLVAGRQGGTMSLSSPADLIRSIAKEIRAALAEELEAASTRTGPVDEAWYWAAPLLLDRRHFYVESQIWFDQEGLAELWDGEQKPDDNEAANGWSQHVQQARSFLSEPAELGPPPVDLCEVMARLALAGPGVASLRALSRIAGGGVSAGVRTVAAALARSFLHLFNLPEVMALVRDRKRVTPFWLSVLSYCIDGNLQSVLDEYAHVLVEALNLSGKSSDVIADKVSIAMQRCVALRTSTAQADLFTAGRRHVRSDKPIRLRTRFAMRFGDQDAEDGSAPTRADQVRAAFNSPFWPFVLATTSVGQEGLDFHPYCHAVVHWNLPSNPVDLEQREGRVHRYKGHALRKNIAAAHGFAQLNGDPDIWSAMFTAARNSRPVGNNDLFPFWVTPDGAWKIERHVPALPHSRDLPRMAELRRSLVAYRMVFGQNRQEDLLQYLMNHVPEDRIHEIVEICRLSLAPTGC